MFAFSTTRFLQLCKLQSSLLLQYMVIAYLEVNNGLYLQVGIHNSSENVCSSAMLLTSDSHVTFASLRLNTYIHCVLMFGCNKASLPLPAEIVLLN